VSIIDDFSNGLAGAVEKGGAATLLVDARKRYPASGIAFAQDLVLTADHVVSRDENLAVVTPAGDAVPASLAGRDPGTDLALLRLAQKALTPARPAGSPPRIGQLVLALGRPSRAGIQASWGVVSAIGGPTRTGRGGLLDQYIQTETTPYPGFSGGPLIDTEGAVLGLNTSGLLHGNNLTVPTKVAWAIAESLSVHGSVKRGYLGIRTQAVELPESYRQSVAAGRDAGLLVLWIEANGPAAKGGLLVGDILTGVAGSAVAEPDDIFAALASETVGKSVKIEILRGGKAQALSVVLGERR
jgi:S1-C subfamily serine protease